MADLAVPVSNSDHILGKPDAKIVLVEYGDYQCPYCGKAYPVVKQIAQQFADQVCVVFRNYPLAQSHPQALPAAVTAEFAAQHGKFWEAHDALYENQNALRDRDLEAYGRRLGLDAQTIEAALNGANDARIQDDFSGGVRSGVNGTPTLFVNGLRYDGPRDLESLAALVQDLSPSIPAA